MKGSTRVCLGLLAFVVISSVSIAIKLHERYENQAQFQDQKLAPRGSVL